MSLSKRNFLILSCAGLSACGFSPILSQKTTYRFVLPEAKDSDSYNFRKELNKTLIHDPKARYVLSLNVSISSKSLAITQDGIAHASRMYADGMVTIYDKTLQHKLPAIKFHQSSSLRVSSDRLSADENVKRTKERLAESTAYHVALKITRAVTEYEVSL